MHRTGSSVFSPWPYHPDRSAADPPGSRYPYPGHPPASAVQRCHRCNRSGFWKGILFCPTLQEYPVPAGTGLPGLCHRSLPVWRWQPLSFPVRCASLPVSFLLLFSDPPVSEPVLPAYLRWSPDSFLCRSAYHTLPSRKLRYRHLPVSACPHPADCRSG